MAGVTCASHSTRLACDVDAPTLVAGPRRQRRWPKQVGPYALVRYLNAGGMGLVFEGQSRISGLPVAIKFMDPDALYPQKEERFAREAIALRALRHEGIVRFMDFGQTGDGLRYLVMEYVAGWTLSDLVARQGALPPQRALSLLRQVCEALAEAHAMGIAHRDLKPSNVMVQRRVQGDEAVKLIDFGLAKLPGASAEADPSSPRLFVGTPGYAPPEVWSSSDACEVRGDVYGVGLVAHHLLTSAAPPDPVETVVNNSRRLLDELRSRAPDWLVSVIARCLSIDPLARFADARELLRALPAC